MLDSADASQHWQGKEVARDWNVAVHGAGLSQWEATVLVEAIDHTNPHKKMRICAWISTFSITHYEFQRGNYNR